MSSSIFTLPSVGQLLFGKIIKLIPNELVAYISSNSIPNELIYLPYTEIILNNNLSPQDLLTISSNITFLLGRNPKGWIAYQCRLYNNSINRLESNNPANTDTTGITDINSPESNLHISANTQLSADDILISCDKTIYDIHTQHQSYYNTIINTPQSNPIAQIQADIYRNTLSNFSYIQLQALLHDVDPHEWKVNQRQSRWPNTGNTGSTTTSIRPRIPTLPTMPSIPSGHVLPIVSPISSTPIVSSITPAPAIPSIASIGPGDPHDITTEVLSLTSIPSFDSLLVEEGATNTAIESGIILHKIKENYQYAIDIYLKPYLAHTNTITSTTSTLQTLSLDSPAPPVSSLTLILTPTPRASMLLSLELIKGIHRTIGFGIIESAGELHHHCNTKRGLDTHLQWRDVPTALSAFIDDVNTSILPRSDIPCYIKAGMIMYWFCSPIHPFSDVNGRVARVLGNLVLLSSGLPFPFNSAAV